MEGDPISVNESIILPAQPAGGVVNYVPLGGDGFTSPFAAYTVNNMNDTGDATGGSAVLKVTMDPRFCALIQYVTWNIGQATPAAAEFRLRIVSSLNAVPLLVSQGTAANISLNVSSGNEVGETWTPTPIILPGSGGVAPFLEARFANVDTDVYKLFMNIFLFNIRVRELTPMGPLLWARGST